MCHPPTPKNEHARPLIRCRPHHQSAPLALRQSRAAVASSLVPFLLSPSDPLPPLSIPFYLAASPLPFLPPHGHHRALARRPGRRRRPLGPLLCFPAKGRRKKGCFALNPLPFLLFLKESLPPYMSLLNKGPSTFIYLGN